MLKLLKKTAGDTLVYSLGTLSTKIVGFILIPVYTAFIPVSEYGVLGLLEGTSLAIISIFGLNLYYSFLRWYYEEEYKNKQGELFYTSTIFLILFSVIVSIPIFLFSKSISSLLFETSKYTVLVNLMIVSSMIQIITTLPATLMRLQEKPKMFVITNITRLIVTLVLTLYFLIVQHLGLKGIFIAQMIGNVIYTLLVVKYTIRNFTFAFHFKALKEMLRYGLPMIYASFSGIIISLADKYILNASSGLTNTGLYTFGYKIANTVYYFIGESINLALSPIIFAIMNDENNKRFYSKIMTYLAFLILLIILGMSLFCKEIIVFLARKPEYYDAYKIIPIIAFSALFMIMRDTAMRALNIVKKTTVISIVVIGVSVFNLGLNLLLISKFDIFGAAFSFLFTQVLYFGLIYYFAQKYYFIPYEKWKLALMIFMSIIILSIGLLFFTDITWINLLIKVGLLGIFPVVLYFFNFYEKVELQKIRALVFGSR